MFPLNIHSFSCFSLLTCDLVSAGPCGLLFCCCACSCWICSNDLTGWFTTAGLSAQLGTPRACCSRCWAWSCCNLSSRCCLSLSSCCWIWAIDMVPDTGVGAPHRDPPDTYTKCYVISFHTSHNLSPSYGEGRLRDEPKENLWRRLVLHRWKLALNFTKSEQH